MITFILNGKAITTSVDADMPILWYLRDEQKSTGTKFGCGKGLCGACTILVNNQAIRSCLTPINYAQNKVVTTIEGLHNLQGDTARIGKTVQSSWIKENVPQCGYCQGGQILSAVSLLNQNRSPDTYTIKHAMSGNLCRCGTYPRIKKAMQIAVKQLQD